MSVKTYGRYEIQRELGRGGMASVYLAYDPRFRREVALKVLPSQFTHDPMFRARFEREAQTIAALEHPAIVPVHDFGEDHGQPYIVMRYMSGGSLVDWLAKGPIPLEQATVILARVAGALDRAHKQGVIHRDLKPGNILFDQYDDAFLADFGIAKIVEATAALTGSGMVGTPAYMSPEQVKGEQIDGRADIYTLGVILYEMLVGAQPYEATTPYGLMFKHVHEPVPHLLDKMDTLPPSLDMTISKAMAKKVDHRFETAGEMAASVTAVTHHQPQIKPTPLPEPVEEEPPLPIIETAVTRIVPETIEPPTVEATVEEVELETAEPIPTETVEPIPVEAPEIETSASLPTAVPQIEPQVEIEPEVEMEAVSEPALATAKFVPLPAKVEQPPLQRRLPVWAWGIIGLVLLALLIGVGRGLLSRGTAVSEPDIEQRIAGTTASEFIQQKWGEGFRITDLTYGDGVWGVIMSQNSPYGRQTYYVTEAFPTETIEQKWKEGFRITDLTYSDGVWGVVLSQDSPYGRQTWYTTEAFPKEVIQQKWEEGFRITDLAYGDGVWGVVLSQDSPYGRQTWYTTEAFSTETIQQKWEEGFRITSVAYGDGVWGVVLSQNTPYGRQTWFTTEAFPAETIQQKWEEGFRITSVAYGDGVWGAVLSQDSPYGRQTWQLVPDF
ncbi:MAG: serine/threonine protein kinase [Chloroflexi bacterium]|nr:serine/threonine protein kinase [Chloroflexota bacterium]